MGVDSKVEKYEFEFFNKFQNDFYRSVANFQQYNNHQINQNVFKLLTIMAKGYPVKAYDLLNIWGDMLKIDECPDLIRALQHDFANGYKRDNMKHVFFKKSTKKAKIAKNDAKILKRKNKPRNVVDFPLHIQDRIQSILVLDNKDYETLKYTDSVQRVGLELTRRFEKSQIKLIKQG